jgi:hypothetical protein
MTVIHPPRHIVWSTDQLDLSDPYQRRWYLRQVLTHGRAEDILKLDLNEIRRELDDLHLPPDVYSLWKSFLAAGHVEG